MLKKRIIGVVTVKDGWAVQSFGYKKYLPLGKPECVVENLDRWCADEILLQVIDRSGAEQTGPDLALLEKIARLGLDTPLIYGGGIRSMKDGVDVIQTGADRLAVDALLRDDISVIEELSGQLGAQAIIASIPISYEENRVQWLDYRKSKTTKMSKELVNVLDRELVSEALLIDWKNEGSVGNFDTAIVDTFPNKKIPLIVFGGIGGKETIRSLLSRPNVAAVAVGNSLSYREHSVQQLKNMLAITSLRPAIYSVEHPLVSNG